MAQAELPGTDRAYLWQVTDSSLTPSAAAARFAADTFGRERKLLGGGVSGSWCQSGFAGYFHFDDGRRCYRIICERGGHWRIWAE